ncbi:MAG: FAD-dependent monooxygenase [Gammaproteobacteria bacterium]
MVGGGIGGITAALCLARRGHRVTVLEQAPEFAEVGAGIQLSPNCTRVLHDLGLERSLRARAFVPEGSQFRDWRTGRVITESPLGERVVARYGMPYYHIHRGDLLRVLVEAAELANIDLHKDARVDRLEQTGERVTVWIDGATREADLIVGADGIHSVVRAELWGAEKPRFTGCVAWRALVPAERLPPGLIRPVTTAWWGPHKHFVHYYLRRGELINCVCVVEKQGWEVESWTERGDYRELKSDFAGWHPDVQQLIDHVDRDSLFKWALYDRAPMSHWGRGRVTLLGDACHPMLPFMAQGAAMAIEDGAVLAGCLARDEDVAASQQRYEDLRRDRTAEIQNGSRRNAKMFHLTGIKAWLRNRGAGPASSPRPPAPPSGSGS